MNPNVRGYLGATLRTLIRQWNRLNGYDAVGIVATIPKSMRICKLDTCGECGKTGDSKSKLRIIYLLPDGNSPVGGHKVSYQACEIIADNGIQCFAFHAERPAASFTWFSHKVKTLAVGHFDPRTDFLVFSEMWAAIAAEFCVPAGLRYAIYVQNGYLVHNTAGFSNEVLRRAYEHANLVLSISSNTTAMISLTYPFVPPEKIHRIFLSVPSLFSPGNKERLITYMPRKLRAHAERMRLYLENSLPSNWTLQAIENLDEQGVGALLSRSSIFLSFSELEGFGLPPLEAALSGNIVVGYTGQGGKEYFHRPILREVENGDFLQFVEQVHSAVAEVERGLSRNGDYLAQSKLLAKTYSRENETEHLMSFVARVNEIMLIP